MRIWPLFLLLLGCQPTGSLRLAGDSGAPTTDSGTPAGSTTSATPWDPGPVAAPRGSIGRWKVSCGLLQGTPIREFRKVDDTDQRWEMIPADQPDAWPEVAVCTKPTEDYLLWHPDGFIEVWASDLYHDMNPTPVADRWLGTTWPESGSTPECDEALAGLGLTWPVTLTMELVEIVEPVP